MHSTRALLTFALLLLASSIASAQLAFAISGVALGDSRDTALKATSAPKCYAHSDGKIIDVEICELPDAEVDDPIFFATGANRSFHVTAGRVSAFSILVPPNMFNEIARRLEQHYGKFVPVWSPSAKAKGKQNVAFLWQAKGANLLLDGEPTAGGHYGLAISHSTERKLSQ